MNAVAYCRVSTDEQDQLNSLETQKEFFEAYAKKSGYSLVRIYSDKGISGTKTKNRTEFNRMMADAQNGDFSVILVKDISRLARNTVDLLEACRKLRDNGIEIQFINYKMTNMGNSEFLITIFAAIAQEESYNTSQRIKFSKRYHAEQGKVPNLVFGYDKIANDYLDLDVNEKEALVVREIFQRYVENGDGMSKIAKHLNSRGIKTKRGSEWTQTAISRILSNSIYIGKIANGKEEIVNFPNSKRVSKNKEDWIIVENEKLRIIDNETFERTQKLLSERGGSFGSKQHSNKHLFSTLIKCKECGYSFRKVSKTYQNTFTRWVCSTRNLHGVDSCKNAVAIDEDELSLAIRKYFASIISNKKNYTLSAMARFNEKLSSECDTDTRIKQIEKRISEITKQKEKITELYIGGFITMRDVARKLEYTKDELPALEKELLALSAKKRPFEENKELWHKALGDIENIADIRAMTNAQLKKIIKEISVDNGGNVDIYLNTLEQSYI